MVFEVSFPYLALVVGSQSAVRIDVVVLFIPTPISPQSHLCLKIAVVRLDKAKISVK